MRHEVELLALREELLNGSYTPGAYRFFTIHEPKQRLIAAAPLVFGAFGMEAWACARDARSDPGLAWGRAVGTNSSKDRLILAAC